ncbi:MAG: hypothetical protein IT565_14255, partial [Rhodospirillales bacterium]|nr:hypothetical protein [Rhodospirillales bacterium]
MTRTKTYVLTAVSALLYVFLAWVFADGLFDPGNLFSGEYYSDYTVWTYLLLALIIGAGVYQAQKLPAEGVKIEIDEPSETAGQTDDPKLWKLLLGNVYFAIFWMPIRFFVGLSWLQAGEHKVRDDAWVGTGEALQSSWTRYTAVPEPPAR